MKKICFVTAALISVPFLVPYLVGTSDAAAKEKAARSYEAKLWDWLQAAKYYNWAAGPGQNGDFYPGESPHGAFLKMYLNRTAACDVKNLPSGSILIKENYGKDKKTLMAITVMHRSKGYDPKHGDWYWVKYMPNGTVAKSPPKMGSMRLAGKVKGCIMCHSDADGKDFAFINDK